MHIDLLALGLVQVINCDWSQWPLPFCNSSEGLQIYYHLAFFFLEVVIIQPPLYQEKRRKSWPMPVGLGGRSKLQNSKTKNKKAKKQNKKTKNKKTPKNPEEQKPNQNKTKQKKPKTKFLKYQSRGGGPSCLAPFKKKSCQLKLEPSLKRLSGVQSSCSGAYYSVHSHGLFFFSLSLFRVCEPPA